MDKITYLSQLAEGLARWIPERERQDILRYYAEYFEEAGPEREAEVVAELGDPWALSSRLAVEGGYVTQEQAASWAPMRKKRRIWPLVVAVTAAVMVFTVGSAIWTAMRFGRFIGREVSSYISNDAVAEDVADIVQEEQVASIWEANEYASIGEFSSIDVDIDMGNVLVIVTDDQTLGQTLSVNYVPQWRDVKLVWEIEDGVLKVRNSDDMVTGYTGIDWAAMGEVEVPEVIITVYDRMILDKVSVKTDMGDVYLDHLMSKKVTAKTGMGNVQCYELFEVQKLKMETGMGNIALGMQEPFEGVDIDLESGMGHIEAMLGGSEQEWEYDLGTGMGNVSVNGVGHSSKIERKGDMPYHLDAKNGMGDVEVYWEG